MKMCVLCGDLFCSSEDEFDEDMMIDELIICDLCLVDNDCLYYHDLVDFVFEMHVWLSRDSAGFWAEHEVN